jgi:hypothetical protein
MTIEKCHRCVGETCENQVADECLPVSAFGNVFEKSVKIATIGLNPALNEFYLSDYKTLNKRSQRLAALVDYNKASRAGLQEADVEDAKKRREEYFTNAEREPHYYFEGLESSIGRIEPSWSFISGNVVHIDLVACATNVRWRELSENFQMELITNCRGYFLETLYQLPNGTMLSPVGSRVISELKSDAIKKFGLIFEQNVGEQPINIPWNRFCIGKLKLRDKEFPVVKLP